MPKDCYLCATGTRVCESCRALYVGEDAPERDLSSGSSGPGPHSSPGEWREYFTRLADWTKAYDDHFFKPLPTVEVSKKPCGEIFLYAKKRLETLEKVDIRFDWETIYDKLLREQCLPNP